MGRRLRPSCGCADGPSFFACTWLHRAKLRNCGCALLRASATRPAGEGVAAPRRRATITFINWSWICNISGFLSRCGIANQYIFPSGASKEGPSPQILSSPLIPCLGQDSAAEQDPFLVQGHRPCSIRSLRNQPTCRPLDFVCRCCRTSDPSLACSTAASLFGMLSRHSSLRGRTPPSSTDSR